MACSSTYVPRARGRIATILRDGGLAYVRDGRVYEHTPFGAGLLEAVHGNPAAEDAAHEYRPPDELPPGQPTGTRLRHDRRTVPI